MVFRSKKKAKGLIEIKQDQIAEVEAEMTALTDEYNNLWQQYIQYQENGETLKALEAHGQWKHKRENVLSDLSYKRQELLEDLGGVASTGQRTGLVGEANGLEGRIPVLEKQLKAYKSEIEAEKRRAAERIEMIERDIEETKAERDNANQRLSELLGG